MKNTGIVRKVDELGRIKDPVEIFTEGDTIILKKYEPACIFCGQAKDVVQFKGKNICPECKEKIKNI
jgi:transcriptional pleiotropic regulator of transition state genes